MLPSQQRYHNSGLQCTTCLNCAIIYSLKGGLRLRIREIIKGEGNLHAFPRIVDPALDRRRCTIISRLGHGCLALDDLDHMPRDDLV